MGAEADACDTSAGRTLVATSGRPHSTRKMSASRSAWGTSSGSSTLSVSSLVSDDEDDDEEEDDEEDNGHERFMSRLGHTRL